jgi:hypothetical protein
MDTVRPARLLLATDLGAHCERALHAGPAAPAAQPGVLCMLLGSTAERLARGRAGDALVVRSGGADDTA